MSPIVRKIIAIPARATSRAVAAGVNVALAMLTVFSAYGGTFAPTDMVVASLVAMMLPGILVADIVVVVLDLIFWRKGVWAIVAGWVISLPGLLIFSPVNLPHGRLSENEQQRSFTFLTYNTLHFWDFRGDVPGLKSNATIDYILSTDADIVNLQETEFIKSWPLWRITPEQIDSLDRRYPYRVVNMAQQQTLLSKYPFQPVLLPFSDEVKPKVACFKINIKGQTVYVFDVHLESIGLSPADKTLYNKLFESAPGSEKALRYRFEEVKEKLLTKLSKAFTRRARQAAEIRHWIDVLGGNVIVAGDFNDIPGCYAIRSLMARDMKDAYRECGFGPTITYHGNRFYFRIDHVLYKGDFEAVDIERGKVSSSDHFPLLVTFVFDKNVSTPTGPS